MSPDPAPPRRPGWFQVNRRLKALALLLAVAAWYAIREATSFKALVKDVPLQILVDDGYSVLDRSVQDVDVLFRGSQQDLRYVNRDSVNAVVDLRGRSETGELTIRLTRSAVRAPSAARAENFDPSTVAIVLDREGDKVIPVRADLAGTPPEGYAVEDACTPSTVVLHGPITRLEGLQELLTEPIDLAGRVRSFALDKRLRPPSETWSSRVEPDRVKVEVRLAERTGARVLAGVPVRPLTAGDEVRAFLLDPPTVTVKIQGAAGPLEAVDASQLLAFVDCTRMSTGEPAELAVRVSCPPSVVAVDIHPPRVQVRQR